MDVGRVRAVRVLLLAVVVALCGVVAPAVLVAPASAAVPSDTYEGFVESGSYAHVRVTATINQVGVREEALTAIKQWRQDALNDTRVKWPDPFDSNGMTMRQYLQSKGISESEYLNPRWDQRAERVAIQRAVEANSYEQGHDRYIPESVRFNNFRPTYEILAWGVGTATSAVNLWASEKDDAINGRTGAVIGHWTTLINPDILAYGVAGAAAKSRWGYDTRAWAGHTTHRSWTTASTASDDVGTNWKGDLTFTIPLSEDYYKNATPSAWKVTLQEGQSTQFTWRQLFPGGRIGGDRWGTYVGTLTSGNSAVASVSGDRVTGRAVGKTYLKFVSGPMERFVEVEVIPEVVEANATWVVRDNDIAVGASPSNGKYGNYEYRWLSYRVDTGTWTVISDWNAGNWASWAQDKGTYWLRLELRNKATKAAVADKTIAFAHTPGKHTITGTYAGTQADRTVLLGVASSNPKGRYVTKIYDVGRKTWVAQFEGQWNVWRPSPGVYWTHYELYTPSGQLQDVRTYSFGMS